MSNPSIGLPLAPSAIIFTAGPTAFNAIPRPIARPVPAPSVPTAIAAANTAPATCAQIVITCTHVSGSLHLLTKSSPNCFKFASATLAKFSIAARTPFWFGSNAFSKRFPTSSNAACVSLPNLRNASPTPFFSGSNKAA